MDVRSGYDNEEEYMNSLNSLSKPINIDNSRKGSCDAVDQINDGRDSFY